MERIENINAERLLWCCADFGISPSELADQLNISQAVMEKFVDGKQSLTFHQLHKIAEFFGRGVLFFLEQGILPETQVHSALFRTLSNQKSVMSPELKRFIQRVEVQRDIYLSLLEDLDEEERILFAPPELPAHDIKHAAVIVREWLGIGVSGNFETYRKAIETKGILVFRSTGYKGQWQISKDNPFLGFALYDKRCPLIVVRNLDYEPRQTFSLFHELGHILLHQVSQIDDEMDFRSDQKNEVEANAFAGYVLVPDSLLDTINDADRPQNVKDFREWLSRITKPYGVSTEAVLLRLVEAGRLSRQVYGEFKQWNSKTSGEKKVGGNRQYRHREPRHLFGDAFVRTVFDALSARQIMLNKASTYLDNLEIKDVHQLQNYYSYARRIVNSRHSSKERSCNIQSFSRLLCYEALSMLVFGAASGKRKKLRAA